MDVDELSQLGLVFGAIVILLALIGWGYRYNISAPARMASMGYCWTVLPVVNREAAYAYQPCKQN